MTDSTPASPSGRSDANRYTTVMMFVGDYGNASTRWLPAALRRLLDAPAVVLDLTEARVGSGVVDELLYLHDLRAGRGLPRERIVMTEEQASQAELSTLQATFDVMPDLGAAVGNNGGLVALDYAHEPKPVPSDRLPMILTLDVPEWDIETSESLGTLLAPAADHRDVIVDLSAVSYIDSTCLGKFVGMHRKRSAKGYEPARLVIASPRVRRLFAIVKFDEIWPIYETLDEAVRAGASPSAIWPAS